MNESMTPTKRNLPKWALIGGGVAIVLVVLASLGSGGPASINMSTTTSENLIPHIVEMSQDKELKVLEISNPKTEPSTPGGQEIACSGNAEWSRGSGFISYGAHVSNGGQVMLEYKQD